MAAMVGTTLVSDASAAALQAEESRRAGSRRPSASLSDHGSVDGGGVTFGRSDVLRADLRLAAAVSRKGRIGNIVVLEIARESATSASYKEYTRAELLDRVTRIIARVRTARRGHSVPLMRSFSRCCSVPERATSVRYAVLGAPLTEFERFQKTANCPANDC